MKNNPFSIQQNRIARSLVQKSGQGIDAGAAITGGYGIGGSMLGLVVAGACMAVGAGVVYAGAKTVDGLINNQGDLGQRMQQVGNELRPRTIEEQVFAGTSKALRQNMDPSMLTAATVVPVITQADKDKIIGEVTQQAIDKTKATVGDALSHIPPQSQTVTA